MELALLDRAREAGLDISLNAERGLRIRGPRRLGALAAEVLAKRAEIIAILEAGLPVASERPDPVECARDEYLGTIAAQHCHPVALAERLGMPVEQVLRRLETSPWSGHGAPHRAKLGLGTTHTPAGPGQPGRAAPAGSDLHFPAR